LRVEHIAHAGELFGGETLCDHLALPLPIDVDMMTEDGPLALRKAWWNADRGGSGSVALLDREGLEQLQGVTQVLM